MISGGLGCNPPAECFEPPTIRTWDGKQLDGGVFTNDGLGTGLHAICTSLCPPRQGAASLHCTVPDAGLLSCGVACGGGRAPPGLQGLSTVDGSAGSWIARMAELEAAAVAAFAQLADELEAHGLNDHARHAREAALDEVKHAQSMTRLALRLGHCPAPVQIAEAREIRSLEAIAIDNAGEGCGRELFGAVLNRWQSTHASNVDVRAVMASIAGEEDAHAKYAFALAQTLAPRLSVAQRRRAREAQEQMLSSADHVQASGPARRLLGLMDTEQVARTTRSLLDSARL